MASSVRIANAQAFWGDRSDAAAELLAREPDLDYITLDYLAEVSMSILAAQRERNPDVGYAQDFVDVIRSLAPYWRGGGRCRLITNAGGLNPTGCAQACAAALAEAGCRSLAIAVITGDDVLPALQQAARDPVAGPVADRFRHLESAAPIATVADRLVTASAYLGAAPVVAALAAGADIVVTGRIADPSLTVAPCIHHFGWSATDFDRLAGATVAGHLIECGTQVTGGISTDWLEVPDPAHIGFPIVEVSAEGSCIVTKPPGTGGAVTAATVKEQLLYEIGDPGAYLSPDATVSFLSLKVEDVGADRVRVSGATGAPPPATLKVSATFRDGFWAAGTLTIIGRDASAKAHRCGEIVLARVREAGIELNETLIECLPGSDLLGAVRVEQALLRVAARAERAAALERFSKELMPLITAGPPGTTGYAAGRPRVHPLFRYWPCLIERNAVDAKVEFITSTTGASDASPGPTGSANAKQRRTAVAASALAQPVAPGPTSLATQPRSAASSMPPLRERRFLGDIAQARSGDKGTSANVGVIARRVEDYRFLKDWLTAERVAAHLRPLGVRSVTRYELPNLDALNFMLHGALENSLRTDAQGKGLGQVLLAMPLE